MISQRPIDGGKTVSTAVQGYTPEFGDRLSTVIKRIGSLVEAGRLAGVSDEQIAKWRDGASKPNFFGIAELAAASEVSLDWIFNGDGRSSPPSQTMAQSIGNPDMTMIERLDIEAAAGSGMFIDSEQSLDYMSFQTTWLRRKGLNPAFCRLLNIKGDSMEPTIRDGDIALVDTSINEIIDNAIYVLLVGNRLLIKRIHVMISGALNLISDNPIYPPETVPEPETHFVRVAGRVVWYGRTI